MTWKGHGPTLIFNILKADYPVKYFCFYLSSTSFEAFGIKEYIDLYEYM